MQKILIIGAGRSSNSLIQYLLKESEKNHWKISIAEQNVSLAKEKLNGHQNGEVIRLDIFETDQLETTVKAHDLVISMLPASFHIYVATLCAKHKIHLLTASYLKENIKELDLSFRNNGKIALMEMGLDPGIDHMSAMKVLDELKEEGNKLTGFETFTGGLVAPESVGDNPWEYKFTWNPRNVVLAGQGACKFIQEGRYKYIPYHQLFSRTEVIYIPNHGYFEGYANRDSLAYLDVYNLRGIRTLFRGTLRKKGYSEAWNAFVQLGATDDTYEMEGVDNMTHRQFINSFLAYNPTDSVELKLAHYLSIPITSEIMFKIKWLGMFDETPVGLKKGTPAQILEHILKKSWKLQDEDKDMVVMWHKFNYENQKGERFQKESSMVVKGSDKDHTAMAKTVGLPLGIAAKLILQEKINLSGVHIPIKKEIYLPVLDELEKMGFEFDERISNPNS